jgi:hypothetical protein
MDVYPKLTVFCPSAGKEQDGKKCASCQYYQAFKVNEGRLFIDCKFDELAMSSDLYQQPVSTSRPSRELVAQAHPLHR